MTDKNRSSQMLKGILSGCILVLLDYETLYGYTLSLKLEEIGFDQIPKGTIYPLLLSLEKKGFIASTLVPSPDGPSRKYYHLTNSGKNEKAHFMTEWQQLQLNVSTLLDRFS
ncbi:MAG TPA: PadR family transcriptional regulator [Enterococcus sp.]|nr:PadR family transcriptional regulator [Enterococcus sp.]HPR80878.1 PadR family transcriptional regulator [Enterococcus sp.]